MNPSQNFNRLYTDVSTSIAAAMVEISGLNVEHADGKKELSKMMERLRDIQGRFDGELKLLEQHAEWDKFTIAFFGETNAGKSTIIESLRIVFKEDARQQLLQQNSQNLIKYEEALTAHVNQVREGLNTIYTEYAAEIQSIKQGTAALAQVLQDESWSRIKRKLVLSAFGGVVAGSLLTAAILMQMGR